MDTYAAHVIAITEQRTRNTFPNMMLELDVARPVAVLAVSQFSMCAHFYPLYLCLTSVYAMKKIDFILLVGLRYLPSISHY